MEVEPGYFKDLFQATRAKLNDVEHELVQTKRHLEESKRQQRKEREHIEKLQSEERHWKQAVSIGHFVQTGPAFLNIHILLHKVLISSTTILVLLFV